MTITLRNLSKYVYNKDSSVGWVSEPIRMGTVQGYAFVFYANAVTVHGNLFVEEAIDWYDDSARSLTPKPDGAGDPQWCPAFGPIPIVAGLFPNGRSYSSLAEFAAGTLNITFMEGLRLRWVPDGGGSVGTMDVSYYAKSFG